MQQDKQIDITSYRKMYMKLRQKTQCVQKNLAAFEQDNKYDFSELYKKEQEKHLKWFVEHIDYIQKYKEYIKNSPILSKIVIDFMPLFDYAGLASGAAFQYGKKFKIFLGDLLRIWDAGFCYHHCPIISYKAGIHHNTDITIQYIQDKQIKTLQKKVKGSFKHLPDIDPRIFKELCSMNVIAQFQDMMTYRNLNLMMKVCK